MLGTNIQKMNRMWAKMKIAYVFNKVKGLLFIGLFISLHKVVPK